MDVLNEYPDLVEFELTTSSLNGTKFKDLSSSSVVSIELTDNKVKKKVSYLLSQVMIG